MNVISALQEYMNYTFNEVPGMKVLLMDNELIQVVSVLFGMTEIIQKEVYLVQKIEDTNRDKLLHLNAVCILRPTQANIDYLRRELSQPKYGKYYLYFTNFLDHSQIQMLGQSDVHELVEKVMELYIDYMPINDDLFITQCPNYYSVTCENSFQMEQKSIESLTALCLSLKKNPTIRYQGNSELTKRIAEGLTLQLSKESQMFGNGGQSTLIVLDRTFDPISPLLLQWTYQAMIHEFLEIMNGKVDIDGKPVVLSNDQFYTDMSHALFTDITDSIITMVNNLTEKVGAGKKQFQSLDEMRKTLESIPSLQKESAGVNKHLGIMGKINKTISERKLLEISRVEQDIVSGTIGKNELYQSVIQIFSGPYSIVDKIRVALLFVIRFEDRKEDIKEELIIKGIPREEVQIIDVILKYAGQSQRPVELFSRVKNVMKFVKRSVAGVENAYVQHKPTLDNLLDHFVKNELTDKFPFVKSSVSSTRDLIIFIVGGVTFEEEAVIYNRNKNNPNQKIILGGTDILNTQKFMDQLWKMK